MQTATAQGRISLGQGSLVVGCLALALLWSVWPTLLTLAERWSRDPHYSHGFLVPLFAVVVLWFRADLLRRAAWQPSFWGLPLLILGVGLRLVAARMDLE